ncbi:MAG TPA: flagellar protein [Thermoanaerobacterales bacterium]|nr:flagellar protein [Thermoanaerobacterales bacterium]
MQNYSDKIQSKTNAGISPASTGVKKLQTGLKNSFDQILQQKIEEKELKISQHARMRMNMRNIRLTDDQKEILNNAVDKAKQKGVRESLILMQDMAFVVSIKNKTVITVIDGANIKENVFTNIDGAVIM